MESFKEKVINFVKTVPWGKVVSYGQVAAILGSPRAARQVGWALRAIDDPVRIPWWRVVNNEGYLSIKGNWESTKEIQAALLRKEGVEVSEDFYLDMNRYRYQKSSARK